MMKRPKISKVMCDICYKSDEFYLCCECFRKYLEKSIKFRNSINSEKVSLQTLIQEILSKNYQSLLIYNQKLFKLNTIERLKKKLQRIESDYANKQNIINSISLEIKKRKENLKKIREILESERIKLNNSQTNNLRKSKDSLKVTESLCKEKKIKLAKSILNISIINIIDVNEYFMMQEFVKPDVIENRQKLNKENIFKEFDEIQNILSFSDSVIVKDTRDYDIKYEKFIKFKQTILKNRQSIFKLNSFIFSLLSGIKFLSSILDIYLPYEIYSSEDFLILNPTVEKIYCLYLPADVNSTSNLNEVIQGYTYLDFNLKFITKFLRINQDGRVCKKYKSSKSFQKCHAIFTPDLNVFLSVKIFLEENIWKFCDKKILIDGSNKNTNVKIDQVDGVKFEEDLFEIETEIDIEGNSNSIEVEKLNEKDKNEVQRFVLLENYFY